MQANRFASQKNFTNIGLDRLGQQRLSQEWDKRQQSVVTIHVKVYIS
jgi:hypothetical protein